MHQQHPPNDILHGRNILGGDYTEGLATCVEGNKIHNKIVFLVRLDNIQNDYKFWNILLEKTEFVKLMRLGFNYNILKP